MTIPVVIGALGTISKGLLKGLVSEIGKYLNYSSDKVSQNTEKSPANLRRFFVTETPVKNRQLTLVWKVCK